MVLLLLLLVTWLLWRNMAVLINPVAGISQDVVVRPAGVVDAHWVTQIKTVVVAVLEEMDAVGGAQTRPAKFIVSRVIMPLIVPSAMTTLLLSRLTWRILSILVVLSVHLLPLIGILILEQRRT